MRTFYIFKINNDFKTLTSDKPYNLYLALSNIHNMPSTDISLALKLFEELCDKPNRGVINKEVFSKLKESDYYTKFNNSHLINNYFTNESSKLIINYSYLKVKSTINNPTFFNILKNIPNLFVIDFSSKDFFWLS